MSVHDGWGHSDVEKGNAVLAGKTENMDKLGSEGHIRYIAAHGLNVGLNDGLMGNSEVGYVYDSLPGYALSNSLAPSRHAFTYRAEPFHFRIPMNAGT